MPSHRRHLSRGPKVQYERMTMSDEHPLSFLVSVTLHRKSLYPRPHFTGRARFYERCVRSHEYDPTSSFHSGCACNSRFSCPLTNGNQDEEPSQRSLNPDQTQRIQKNNPTPVSFSIHLHSDFPDSFTHPSPSDGTGNLLHV